MVKRAWNGHFWANYLAFCPALLHMRPRKEALFPRLKSGKVWTMKLRFDLVEKITPEMLMETVVANTHRYKAEPLLSKTGTGSLSSASTEDRAREEKLSMDITRKLMNKSANAGKRNARKS